MKKQSSSITPTPASTMSNLYTYDDVQEILQIAIARQATDGELTRQQLLEIGDELGLAEQDIHRAEEEWRSLDGEAKDRQAFCQYRRLQFRHHSIRYGIVVGFFFLLDFFLTGGIMPWSQAIAILWGMFLALDGWSALQTEGVRFERRYQLWKRRRWLNRSVHQLVGRWFKPT